MIYDLVVFSTNSSDVTSYQYSEYGFVFIYGANDEKKVIIRLPGKYANYGYRGKKISIPKGVPVIDCPLDAMVCGAGMEWVVLEGLVRFAVRLTVDSGTEALYAAEPETSEIFWPLFRSLKGKKFIELE